LAEVVALGEKNLTDTQAVSAGLMCEETPIVGAPAELVEVTALDRSSALATLVKYCVRTYTRKNLLGGAISTVIKWYLTCTLHIYSSSTVTILPLNISPLCKRQAATISKVSRDQYDVMTSVPSVSLFRIKTLNW